MFSFILTFSNNHFLRRVLLTEIDHLHLIRLQQFTRFAAQDHPSGFHHIAALRDPQCHLRILFHQKNRCAFAAQLVQHVENLSHNQRCQAHRWLIKQKQFRSRHQRACDGEHLLLASAERAGNLMGALFENGKERVYIIKVMLKLGFGLIAAMKRAQFKVDRDGLVNKNLPAFRYLAQSRTRDPFGRRMAYVLILKSDRAGLRTIDARDRFEQRRLASAVRADDRDNFAGVDLDRNAIERANRSVGKSYAADF